MPPRPIGGAVLFWGHFGDTMSSWRRQFAFGGWALDRRRRCVATCPLKFDFLGHGRDGVADLVDYDLQCISRYAEPPSPGSKLSRVCQVDLIANGRMFYAMHGGISRRRINGIRRPSFHFACDASSYGQGLRMRQRPPEGGPVVRWFKPIFVREAQS